MTVLSLIARNSSRHRLRTSLTVLGLAIAVMAFAVIRTSIDAWYAGAEASSPNRLITRNAISLIFPLPLAYKDKILKVEGVNGISHWQWFGGLYVDASNFFANFAVEHESFLEINPEYVLTEQARNDFLTQRNSAIIGLRLADRFGWKVGDAVTLIGTIYPGEWDFVIRGIYTGAKENTDENQFFFRWDYLDERMRVEMPGRDGQVGTFQTRIDNPEDAAKISAEIDALFDNSLAETKTETEEAFNLSFVAMASSIITGLRIVSYLVIGIILLVLANTMAMTARERVSEYAMMKTLGFRAPHIIGLIVGESFFIAILGGVLGIALTFPIAELLHVGMRAFFPIFKVSMLTLMLAGASSLIVGFLAAIFPTLKAVRTPIVDGLRIVD